MNPRVSGKKRKPQGGFINRFFNSQPHEYKALKAVLGFGFGFILGVGLYYGVIRRLQLPQILDYTLGGAFVLAFSVGYAVSVHARCILLLILPSFFGKSGRSYIGTFALAYLLAGPVSNIMYNAQETTRAIGCSSELAQNMSRSRMKLRLKPLHNIMLDLQKQAVKIHEVTAEARKSFSPIEFQIKGDNDEKEIEEIKQRTNQMDKKKGSMSRSEKIEEKYKPQYGDSDGDLMEKKFNKKFDYRCEDVFSLGVKSCEKKFKDMYDKCKKKMKSVGKAACSPLKLDDMCKLVKVLGKAGLNCNAMDATNPGFGEDIDTAKKAAEAMDKEFDVNMQYKVVSNPEALDRRTAEDVAMAIKYEFKRRKQWIDFCTTLIQRVLAFMFLRVLWSAYKYQKKYSTDFKHDNMYMTDYFMHIDKRRALQGKQTLIPLKKLEKKTMISTKSIKLTAAERGKLGSATFRLLLRGFTYGMIAFVDKLIYEVLDIISRNSRITYKQTGVHHIDLKVHGEGVMADLMESLLGGLTQQHDLHQDASNYKCLPIPTKTDNTLLLRILIVFVVLWVLMIFEAYGLRLRRIIASFFYRKREKKRILYLYNDMLKKRKGFLRHMRTVIRRKAKDLKLRSEQGGLFKCLDKFLKKKRKCLICEEKENKTFVRCPTPRCGFVYCRQCWTDIEFECYACRRQDDWTTTDSSDDLEL